MRLLCCDLSLRRPGFAVQEYDEETGETKVLLLDNVDNKSDRSKCHGEILLEIARKQNALLKDYPDTILVREEALAMISRSAKTQQVLHKVVGVSDLYAWAERKAEFEEINPKTIKLLVAGKDDASKEDVAAALVNFVGEQTYTCDDESDAVAVGIAWLIRHGKMKATRKVRTVKKKKK